MHRYLEISLDVPGSMLIASADVNWNGFLENVIKCKDNKIDRLFGFNTFEYLIIFICFWNFVLQLSAWNLSVFTEGHKYTSNSCLLRLIVRKYKTPVFWGLLWTFCRTSNLKLWSFHFAYFRNMSWRVVGLKSPCVPWVTVFFVCVIDQHPHVEVAVMPPKSEDLSSSKSLAWMQEKCKDGKVESWFYGG